MTQWQVFRESDAGGDAWIHRGTYESGESYYIYGPTAAQELGPRYGAGEYLLLDDESERFKRLTIGERQDFYEVKPEDDSPPMNAEHVVELTSGYSEGDLTAAEVMARDA